MSERRYGPGFERMRARLGAARLEEMRQEVLAEQAATREKIGGEKIVPRDRTSYKDYPGRKR